MKNLLWVTTLLAGVLFAGCSPKKDSGTVGATATTTSIGSTACPTGYWYSNGTCTNGVNTLNSNFSFNNGFYADNYSGTATLSVTNPTKMKELYKYGMGVCDRAANNYGQANCDYYVTGYTDLIMQFPANFNGNALVTVIARPRQNPYYNYQAQFPSGWGLLGIALGYVTGYTLPDPSYYQGAYRNPLQIQMAVSPTNNNQGFEARGYGDFWTGLNQTIVTISVQNGSATTSNTLNYTLLIGNVPVAQGVMTRCQTNNCGL